MKRQRGRNRRSGGGGNSNNPNKHYESNGPDVKIRGSAQQILDKYLQYARDAQTSGDRVNSEAYFQHAEHYARIVAALQPKQKPQRDDGDTSENKDGDARDGEAESKDAGHTQGEQQTAARDGDRSNDESGGERKPRRRRSKRDDDAESGEKVAASDQDAQSDAGKPDSDAEPAPRHRRKRPDYEAKDPAEGEDGVTKTLSRGRETAVASDAKGEDPVEPAE